MSTQQKLRESLHSLMSKLEAQMEKAQKLDTEIRETLESLKND